MTSTLESGGALRFRIDPQPGETRRACAAIVRASLPPRRGNGLMIGLYAVIIAIAFVFTPSTKPQTILVGIGAVLATAWLLQWDGARRIRQLQSADPHERETHFVELSPSGVRAWCAHVDARYPWDDYRAVTRDGEFYLLLRAGGNGTAIPKRLLDADAEREVEARLAEWARGRVAWPAETGS